MQFADFRIGAATDIGRKRTQNQDSISVKPEVGLFLVADGMGGHRGGEIASQMATQIISEKVTQAARNPDWEPQAAIIHAIQVANSAIFERALEDPSLRGMGTTTTAMLFKDGLLTIGHVGDSRCYFLRPSGGRLLIWQLTRDHSLVQEKLRAGMITRDEIKTDRMKNVITRSVGFEPQINVEVYHFEIQPGDLFLACSDGLTGLVEDLKISEVIQQSLNGSQDVEKTVSRLIETANQNGGDDNISSVLVQYVGKP